MIKTSLLDWKFYETRFPLYFRQSSHILSHHRIMFDLLTALDSVYDTLFDLLDINKAGYIANDAILDALGSIYGIQRNVHIHYKKNNGVIVDKDVELNNDEFLLYIKCMIARNNFDGSRENLIEIYNILNIPFLLINTNSAAKAQLYIINVSTVSENLKEVILSKLTLVESMGITYDVSTIDPNKIAKWDVPTYKWDSGTDSVWGY